MTVLTICLGLSGFTVGHYTSAEDSADGLRPDPSNPARDNREQFEQVLRENSSDAAALRRAQHQLAFRYDRFGMLPEGIFDIPYPKTTEVFSIRLDVTKSPGGEFLLTGMSVEEDD